MTPRFGENGLGFDHEGLTVRPTPALALGDRDMCTVVRGGDRDRKVSPVGNKLVAAATSWVLVNPR